MISQREVICVGDKQMDLSKENMFEVKEIAGKGKGLFALQRIKKGTYFS